jgi:hypothetical protein
VLDRHDLAHFSRSSLWISAVMQLSPSVRALGPGPPHTRHHSAGVVQHDAGAGSLRIGIAWRVLKRPLSCVDEREHIYTREQLENAETHDEY